MVGALYVDEVMAIDVLVIVGVEVTITTEGVGCVVIIDETVDDTVIGPAA